jgi:N-carbamoylputrescine amidase
MERARDLGAGLIVFPELAIDRFFPQHERLAEASKLAEPIPGPSTKAVAEKAGRCRLVTVFNLYEKHDAGGTRYYDSSPVFNADGELLGVTRMVHITDYACFHERAYYHPGDRGAPVYSTAVGRVGVAICYDRHYPEYMRALALNGAELVAIPQAGAEKLTFAGESFVVDPEGQVVARGKSGEDDLVIAELDLSRCAVSTARRLFWRDRRPELYREWFEPGKPAG